MTSAEPRAPSAVRAPVTPFDATLLAIGVVAVSTSGPLMAAAVAPALAIAFWRNALGAVATAPAVLLRQRGELRRLGGRQTAKALLAGVLLAGHFAAWVPSLTMTSVATATALVCLQPVWTAIIARARGQSVGARSWLGIGLAVLGAIMLTGVDLDVGGRALAGDLLALLGGIVGALYVVVGEDVRQAMSTATYTTACYATAALVLLVACLASGAALGGYDARTWWIIVAVTVGPQLLGHTVFNRALRTVSATFVSLVILLEIPGAAIIAWIWLDQPLTGWAFPALAILLVGLAIIVRAAPRGSTPAVPAE